MTPSGYILNPQARLMLTVSTPVRASGMQSRTLVLNEAHGLIKGLKRLLGSGLAESLAQLLAGADPDTLPAEHLTWLREMGILVAEADLPRQPLFAPSLSTTDSRESGQAAANLALPADLVLNPSLTEQLGPEPPLALAAWLPGWEQLSPARPLLWAREPLSQAWLPVWLVPELLAKLKHEGLGPGLDPDLRRQLYQAGLLIPAAAAELLGPGRAARLDALRAQLRSQACLHLRSLLPPLHRNALAAYARELADEGFFQDGDAMVPERRIIHNESLMRFLHLQLTPFLQELVGEPLMASYALLADYGPGSILRRHTDRSQCDWNLSLVLDQGPDASEPWPLWIENASGPTPVALEIGDLVFYSGTRTPHWREQLPPGRRVTVALFHFVSASYSGSLL